MIDFVPFTHKTIEDKHITFVLVNEVSCRSKQTAQSVHVGIKGQRLHSNNKIK